MRRELVISTLAIALGPGAMSAGAADSSAGKTVAQSQCVQCHEADDWDGEDSASLESLISDIVAGKVKHKTKLNLKSAEIAAVAAYWSESSRKR